MQCLPPCGPITCFQTSRHQLKLSAEGILPGMYANVPYVLVLTWVACVSSTRLRPKSASCHSTQTRSAPDIGQAAQTALMQGNPQQLLCLITRRGHIGGSYLASVAPGVVIRGLQEHIGALQIACTAIPFVKSQVTSPRTLNNAANEVCQVIYYQACDVTRTMQDAQRVKIVHAGCNVNQAPADGVLHIPTTHWFTSNPHMCSWLLTAKATNQDLKILHSCTWLVMRNDYNLRQNRERVWCSTMSRLPSSRTSFFCTSALSRLPLSAYSSSIHVSLMSLLPPSISGPFSEACADRLIFRILRFKI